MLLLLPVLLILYTIAWVLTWAGDQPPQPVQTKRKGTGEDYVHVTVNLPQEEQEITT
jgi:hypothetical protein